MTSLLISEEDSKLECSDELDVMGDSTGEGDNKDSDISKGKEKVDDHNMMNDEELPSLAAAPTVSSVSSSSVASPRLSSSTLTQLTPSLFVNDTTKDCTISELPEKDAQSMFLQRIDTISPKQTENSSHKYRLRKWRSKELPHKKKEFRYTKPKRADSEQLKPNVQLESSSPKRSSKIPIRKLKPNQPPSSSLASSSSSSLTTPSAKLKSKVSARDMTEDDETGEEEEKNNDKDDTPLAVANATTSSFSQARINITITSSSGSSSSLPSLPVAPLPGHMTPPRSLQSPPREVPPPPAKLPPKKSVVLSKSLIMSSDSASGSSSDFSRRELRF